MSCSWAGRNLPHWILFCSVLWCPKWNYTSITDKPLTSVFAETRIWSRWRKWYRDRVFSGLVRIFRTSDQFHCRFLCSFHLPVDTVKISSCLVYIYISQMFASFIYLFIFLFSLLSVSLSIHPPIHPLVHLYDCVYVFRLSHFFFLFFSLMSVLLVY